MLSGLYMLKSGSHVLTIYFSESPLKMMENASYFILKALFVLGHAEKPAWISLVSSFMTLQPG